MPPTPKKYLLIFLSGILFGCAQMMAPTGGPRDSQPPKVVSFSPVDGAVNQKEKKINIQFDEFIQVKDAGSWLVSPPQKQIPEFKVKGKSLEIELKDTLKENTTYSITFGSSIADFTEGNLLPSFKYVFSTGSFTDSLIISGQALNISTGKAEKDISILLYREEKCKTDSLFFKSEPDFFASADEQGTYTADHLPAGKFLVAAIGDKNKNLRFDPPEEWIGYTAEMVWSSDTMQQKTADIHYFKIQSPQYLKKSDNSRPAFFLAQFNRPYNKPTIDILGEKDSLFISWTKNYDTLSIWDLSKRRDSIAVLVFEEKNKDADTLNIRFRKNNSDKEKLNKARFKTSAISFPNLSNKWKRKPGEKMILIYQDPVKSYDTTLIEVLCGTNRIMTKWNRDSSDLRKLIPEVPLPYTDSTLRIILLPGAITGLYSNNTDTLKLEISTGVPEDYGNLTISLNGPGGGSFLVELLNERNQTVDKQTSALPATLSYTNIDPGNYHFKITEDANLNGRWDEGNPVFLSPPERIFLPVKTFEIRANWDLEEEIVIGD